MVPRKFSFALCLLPSLILAALAQEPLSEKTTQAIDRAAAALREGRLGEVLSLIEPVIQTKTPDELRLVDQELRGVHGLEMSALELAAFCRVELVLTGHGGRLGRAPAAILPVVLEALDDRIAFLVEPVRREVDAGMPAIVPDVVMAEKIASIRPLLTHVDQAGLLATHIHRSASQLSAADRAGLEPRPRDIANRKLTDEQKQLDKLRDRLTGRLVDFSLVRLNNALNTLLDDTISFQRRFAATQEASESLATLQVHWESYKRWKQQNGGLDRNVEARVRRQKNLVHIQSGPLLQKVTHFDEGCRWWLRGRFGQGPIGGGLAKVVPAGLNYEQSLQWLANSPLLMPQVIRKPQNPLTVPNPFPIARRHLEWWRFETRVELTVPVRLPIAAPGESMAHTALLANHAPPKFSGSWVFRKQLLEGKPEDIRLGQLVGYIEYANALYHFERLIELATPAELRTIDDIIGQDDRFVVHSNLSSQFDNLDPASTLQLPRPMRDPRAAQPNERRGLQWIMALARVELGAMRAGHTGELANPIRRLEYAKRYGTEGPVWGYHGPFDRWPPRVPERDAFLEILFDGARQHYYESRTEYQIAARTRAETEVFGAGRLRLFQLERKLRIAIEMLEAFRNLSFASLSPAQHAELERWLNQLTLEEGLIRGRLFPPPHLIKTVRVNREN